MADVNIDYHCGCGYKTKRLEEAIKHSESSRHTLGVLGTVRTSKDAVVAGESTRVVSDFEQLRSKLTGKD